MTRQIKCPCCENVHECKGIQPNESVARITYVPNTEVRQQLRTHRPDEARSFVVESWDEHR